jgi:mannose-6-phosphate isomerase-like protein (cupin superfamily)
MLAGLSALLLSAPAARAADLPFASAGQVQALVAKAQREIKPGQAILVQPLLTSGPYRENLEYRVGVGVAAIHETEDEVFYVVDGSGLLQTGGQVVRPKRVDAHDVTGTALEGAASRPVAKGDFFVVPHQTPHWFSRIDGTLVLMSLHVPAGGAPAR